MTAPGKVFFPYGAKHARIYALSGVHPAATSTTVYEGLQAKGLQAADIAVPDARRITSYGDGVVQAVALLQATDATGFTLTVGSEDFDLHAAVTGTKVHTIGEMYSIMYNTEKDAIPVDVMVVVTQAAMSEDGAETVWVTTILPVSQAVPKKGTIGDEFSPKVFDILVKPANYYPWGVALSESNNGATQAGMMTFVTDDPLLIVAFKGDNVATEFSYATAHQAVSSAKTHVVGIYDASGGTYSVDATATKDTDAVTPTAKPDTGDIVIVAYETTAL